jgi:hypothetical protein
MQNLKKDGEHLISDYQKKVLKLKTDLIAKINELPDNPRIKRIGEEGRCFSMSHKDLGESWSVFYHDFKMQYEALIHIINTSPIETVIPKFEAIIEKGSIKETGTYRNTLKFHPDVRAHLKEMM